MALDWDNIQEQMGGQFKDYANDGKYTVKCTGVEIKEVGTNGSVIMKFGFEENEKFQFPTADHWLSFKNDSWRAWHNKNLFELFGLSEDQAKKSVEMAEGKDSKENKIKAYEQLYKKLLAKKPEVEIEVFTEENPNNGKAYARADFTARSVAMPRDNDKPTNDDPLAGAEDVSNEISDGDIPF